MTTLVELRTTEPSLPRYQDGANGIRRHKEDVMLDNASCKHDPECDVCCAPHDEEIHEATLSVHRWFHFQVTRYLYEPEAQGAVQVA